MYLSCPAAAITHVAPFADSQIVPESDDPTLPSLTFRVFFLGSILCVFGGALRALFAVLGRL